VVVDGTLKLLFQEPANLSLECHLNNGDRGSEGQPLFITLTGDIIIGGVGCMVVGTMLTFSIVFGATLIQGGIEASRVIGIRGTRLMLNRMPMVVDDLMVPFGLTI
jgi:hypothetical protein